MPVDPVTGVPRPVRVPPRLLSSLGSAESEGDVAVSGITAASALVQPGDLFCGVPGRAAHGASFAADALDRGAVAVLTDAPGRELVPAGTPLLVVPDVRAALGPLSAEVYGHPSAALGMLGVTGTSGKTTTTFLLRAGLLAAGRTPGLIGTVATLIGSTEIQTGFTTPEAPELQALLATMRERGVSDVAIEVSSHAVSLRRVDGMRFDVGGFTNLSEDHLDFHRDMEDYFAAKMRFIGLMSAEPVVVIDDGWGRRAQRAVGDPTTVTTLDLPARWRANDVEARTDGSTVFRVRGPGGDFTMGCAIPGRYNVANALLAVAMLAELGLDPAVTAPAVSAATVPGRMERVDAGQPFLAIVDYSHKPAAVDGALRALRPLTRGKLIIVLGCGGDRDRGKRPRMGELAARGADLLIVTDDNPRTEYPPAIRRAMLAGALAVPESERGAVREIGDRAEAIAAAVTVGGPGDTVLIAGKGHETGQDVDGVKHPFDDRVVLREAIEAHR